MAAINELPDRPSLENLKKRAKCLHKRVKAGEPDSVARVKEHLPRLLEVPEDGVPDAGVTLQEVQYVIAVEYGYAKWGELVADVGREASPVKLLRKLFGRPSLESLKRGARNIQREVEEGAPWSAARVRKNLSRPAGITDTEVANTGVTLEEAQQIVAAEYGYSRWDELAADVVRFRPVSRFEDLAELEDGEIEEIIARVGRDNLAIAMKAASDRFKDRFLGLMTEKERTVLTEYIEFLGPMLLTDVEAVQRRIVDKFRTIPEGDDVFV